MIPIYFKKLRPTAIIPSFGHDDNTNAGVDFYACIDKPIIIWPKCSATFGTGVSWYVDTKRIKTKHGEREEKLGMILQSRSGLAINKGLECSNAGVIDQGYSGEIKIKLYNNSFWFKKILPNDRVAQGIVEYLPMIKIEELGENEIIVDSTRKDKGFGSSGR
jgi:dUTP pyrophosphatase